MIEKIKISNKANKALVAFLKKKITLDECEQIQKEAVLRLSLIYLKEEKKCGYEIE